MFVLRAGFKIVISGVTEDTNAPVDAGEYLEVTVQVENPGDADAKQTVRLIAGDDQVTSRS